MSPFSRLPPLLAVVCVVLSWTASAAHAQSLDRGFLPAPNLGAKAFAVQADGKIVIGGFFHGLRGVDGPWGIGRVGRDGSFDAGFFPGIMGPVHALAIQPDGKILVGGEIRRESSLTNEHLLRLNADGSLDTSFAPVLNGPVLAMALQPDGKIVIGGSFSIPGVGGAATRHNITRFNADGSLDTGFAPSANGAVRALALQPDGKVVIGGDFFELTQGGLIAERNYVARLHANGTIDVNFNPGADDAVLALAVQADGKVLVGGEFSRLGEVSIIPREHIGRVNGDGTLDTDFQASANGDVEALLVQPDGKILVGGAFSFIDREFEHFRGRIARLNPSGSVDESFNVGANDRVLGFTLQPDGNVLVAGLFTRLGGGGNGRFGINSAGRLYPDGSADLWMGVRPNATVFTLALERDGGILLGGGFNTIQDGSLSGSVTRTRNRIARLTAAGALDEGFDPDANGAVRAFAVQPDGKVLIGGFFTNVGGVPRNYVARLNRDGTVDQSFDAQLTQGAFNTVFAIALEDDGDIIIGGIFSSVGGAPRANVARVHSNGSVDPAFSADTDGAVHTVVLQRDGKVLIGGTFIAVAGIGRSRLARLTINGVPDGWNPGAGNTVYAIVVQPDGKAVVGGQFTTLGGQTRRFIGRVSADGVLDAFDPGATDYVQSLALQTDGKILVAGAFIGLGGGTGTVTRIRVGRLNGDGTVDAGFDLQFLLDGALNNLVYAIAVQGDGKIVASSQFYIERINNTTVPIQHLAVAPDGGQVSWSRTDSGDVSHVTFDVSTDGVAYTPLGNATRVGSEWRLAGVGLPFGTNVFVRAQGYFSSGLGNGSSSIVESVRNVYLHAEFTDDPLIPGVTSVKALHIIELRARVNALRLRHGLVAYGWSTGISVGGIVRAQDILDVRAALAQVYDARARQRPSYTDSSLGPGAPIKAVHITELRTAVVAAD